MRFRVYATLLSVFGRMRTGLALSATLLPIGLTPAFGAPAGCLYEENRASVVQVTYSYWATGEPEPGVELGSGFVISGDGHILTADHVISNDDDDLDIQREKIEIRIGTRLARPWTATVLQRFESLDLALLLLDEPVEVEPAPIGNDAGIEVGHMGTALGFPLEANLTVTGPQPLSSRSAMIGGEVRDFWQFNLPLNPGNSGGPVFGELGTVIGIAVAKSRQGEALSYVVPIDRIRDVLSDLRLDRIEHSSCATFPMCRHADHGVERYNIDVVEGVWGGWRRGGYSQSAHCNDVRNQLATRYPEAEFFETNRGENARWTGTFGRTREYRYFCEFRVVSSPVYKEVASASCLPK